MKEKMILQIFGSVQGVNLRSMIKVKAFALGLAGYVMNNSDGTVTIEAEAERPALEALMTWLREQPANCRIDRIADEWSEATGTFNDFTIKY